MNSFSQSHTLRNISLVMDDGTKYQQQMMLRAPETELCALKRENHNSRNIWSTCGMIMNVTLHHKLINGMSGVQTLNAKKKDKYNYMHLYNITQQSNTK